MRLFVAIVLIALQLPNCGQSNQGNGQTEIKKNRHNSTEKLTDEKERSLEETMDDFKQINRSIVKEIEKLSGEWNLKNLVSKKLEINEIEIRFWTSIFLWYPKAFVYQRKGDKVNVFHFAPKIVSGKVSESQSGRVIIDKRRLIVSIYQGKKFEKLLTKNGIEYPMGLVSDKNHVPDPDERYFVLEIKFGERYGRAFYSNTSTSKDGEKIKGICKMIEKEFDILLGCR